MSKMENGSPGWHQALESGSLGTQNRELFI